MYVLYVRPGRCKACAVKSLKLLRIFKLSFMKVKSEIQAVSWKGTHNRRVARPEKRVRQGQPRLAYKSSRNFFHEREARAGGFFMFSAAKASESSTCFPCKKSLQVTSFWRELFASLSRVLSCACVVASCQSMSKQTRWSVARAFAPAWFLNSISGLQRGSLYFK